MKLKLDEDGHAVLEDGKPVYETDDGAKAFDVPKLMSDVSALNQESAERRVRIGELETQAKKFKGLDAKAAREAIAFRSALGEDFDADGVTQKLATLEAEKAGLVSQIEEKDETLTAQSGKLWDLTVGKGISDFTAGEWAKEHLLETYTPERLKRLFGEDFTQDNGHTVLMQDGRAVMSQKTPGSAADVVEALELVIGADKTMQKASGASGSGQDPRSNGKVNLGSVTKRSDLKSPAEKVAFIKDKGREAFESLPAD